MLNIHFFILITAILAIISVEGRSVELRTCGSKLVERLADLCDTRGGYKLLEQKKNNKLGRDSVFGIVNECCIKSCTNRHLVSYCLESGEIDDDLTVEQDIPPDINNISAKNRYNIIFEKGYISFTTKAPHIKTIVSIHVLESFENKLSET